MTGSSNDFDSRFDPSHATIDRPGPVVPTAARGDLTGTTVSHYRVGSLLGEGGMGAVYEGFDETLKRKVALKAIRSEHRFETSARARFKREATTLSQLDHPNICRIYDYIEEKDRDWLVLELIDGRSLHNAIRSGMDLASKARAAEQIANVLVATHAADVVHRDLKPGNVMVTEEGDVKVLDFGLARLAESVSDFESPDAADIASLESDGTTANLEERLSLFATEAHRVVGTPVYMSPEQSRGELAAAASDMYSFGLLLQELITERAPYDKTLDSDVLFRRIQKGETLPPDGAPADWADLIQRLKSFAASRRPTAVETLARIRWIRDKPKRRLRQLVAVGVLVALVLAGLKYTTDLRRERAVADQRREQAEALIGFMLGDLRAKLEPMGRLEILNDVGNEALDYFASVSESELSDEELFRRSQALSQLADVRIQQGDLNGALEPLRESISLATDLVARDPEQNDWQLGLGTTQYWMGHVLLRLGDLEGALDHWEAYHDIARELVRREPENRTFQLELGYTYSNLGSVLRRQGQLEAARASFLAGLEIENALSSADPEDLDLRHDIGGTHNTLGQIAQMTGELEDALRHFEQETTIQTELVARDPEHTRWSHRLATARLFRGQAHLARGHLEAALVDARAAVERLSELAAEDPTNSRWRRDLATAHLRVGDTLRIQGKVQESRAHLEQAMNGIENLLAEDPEASNVQWLLDQAEIRLALAELNHRERRPERARELATQAVDEIAPLVDESTEDSRARVLLSRGHVTLGRSWAVSGTAEMAQVSWVRGLEIIEPLAKGSDDGAILEPFASALLELDRLEEARPIVDKLNASGYRKEDFLSLCERKGISLAPTVARD